MTYTLALLPTGASQTFKTFREAIAEARRLRACGWLRSEIAILDADGAVPFCA